MSPRPKARANGRVGLWQDLPGAGPVPAEHLPPEAQVSPKRRPCPACKARPGEPCTSPSHQRGGRRDLKGYHASRLNPSEPTTQETP